jgi:DNA-binding NarL/FixJ family response regulator
VPAEMDSGWSVVMAFGHGLPLVDSQQDGAVARRHVLLVSNARVHSALMLSWLAASSGFRPLGAVKADACTPSFLHDVGPAAMVIDTSSVPAGLLALSGAERLSLFALAAYAVDEDDEKEILRYAALGVHVFLGRDDSLEDLRDSIEAAFDDRVRCSPRIATLLVREFGRSVQLRAKCDSAARLTAREREVLVLRISGLETKHVARRLGREIGTVKNQVHSALQKLGVHRVEDAAALLKY